MDQHAIRTPWLANLKFLREYRNVTPLDADVQAVLRHMSGVVGEISLELLLEALAPTDDDKLYRLTAW